MQNVLLTPVQENSLLTEISGILSRLMTGTLRLFLNMQSSISRLKDIVICGHSDCGALKALEVDTSKDAYIPLWINNAREAQVRVDARLGEAKTDEKKAIRKREIECENVRLQLEHLRTYPLVYLAEKAGTLEVHGLYYNLNTGVLSKIA